MRRRTILIVAAAVLLMGAAAAGVRELRAPQEQDGAVQTVIPTPTDAEAPPTAPAEPPPARRVTVTVRDRLLGRPLAGALVEVGGGGARRTDADGVVALPRPRTGRIVVSVTADGYDRVREAVTFTRERPFATVWAWRPQWSWPVYGATPERAMAQPAIDLRPPLRTRWARKFDGMLEFPPVTANGVAYVATAVGTLTAFRTEDGAWLWQRKLREQMASSPAVSEGRVFLATWRGAGQMRAFAAHDGRLLWQRALGSASESSPLVIGRRVFTATVDGHVLAYSAVSGRLLWRVRPGGKLTGALARSGADLVIGDYDGRVHALRAADGAVHWTVRVGGQIYATPSVADGRIFVTSSTDKTISALSAGDGHLIWRRELEDWAYPAAAVSGGVVVTASYGAVLRAFRAADGRPLWSRRLGERVYGSPQIVAGVVWVSSFNSTTHAHDLRSGRLLQRFPHGRYVPISGDARTLLLVGYSRIWGLRPG